MKRFKGALVALLFVIAAIMPISIISTPAHAVSPYDHVINPIGALKIVDIPNASECVIDVSITWSEDFRSFLSGSDLESFDNREAWAASVVYGDDGYGFLPAAVYVYWWEPADLPDSAVFMGSALMANPTRYGYISVEWGTCELSGGVFPDYGYSVSVASSGGEVRPFILYGVDVNYPVGYEGEYIPDTYTPPMPTYVAMGDSFSSGEGNPPFEYGTNESGLNECRRSPQAYPRLLQNDTSLGLGSMAFVACSGATTADVLSSQMSSLSEDTEVVTITVGGNDVGFREYAYSCLTLGCGAEGAAFSGMVDRILDPDFENDLKQTFVEILSAAPNADVYVLNYPYITASGEAWCGGFNVATARPVQELLNYVIWGAVWDVGLTNSRIHLVDSNASGSPFEGKYLCNGGEEYFNGVDLVNHSYSLHPNAPGHEAYYQLMKEAHN